MPVFGALGLLCVLVGVEDMTAIAIDTWLAISPSLSGGMCWALGVAFVCFCWGPALYVGVVYQGEVLPFCGGLAYGWARGTMCALAWETLLLVILGSLAQSRLLDDDQLLEGVFDGFPESVRLAARVRGAIEAGQRTTLGALYGFLAAPAVVKDVVAAAVLRPTVSQLLLWRLPSAGFYAASLAYFGHRASMVAAYLKRSHGIREEAKDLAPGGMEELFGLVLLAVIAAASSRAYAELQTAGFDDTNPFQIGQKFGKYCDDEIRRACHPEWGEGRASELPPSKHGSQATAWTPLRAQV